MAPDAGSGLLLWQQTPLHKATKAMRIIVIGGTGFIGSYVVARLAAEH